MNKEEFIRRFQHIRQVKPEADFPLLKAGKPAAVLIPIIERADQLTVLFTQRAMHLKNHPGQVSFPGGKLEDSDINLAHTALRETQEEIGLTSDKITLIGSLPKFRTVSRFEVTPFLSFVEPEFDLVLDRNEVDNVFEVPLLHLMDKQNHLIHWVKRNNAKHPIYFITWQDKTIWGATASFVRLLSNHIDY
ncbi:MULTISPECIES: CoA pyrophosphatase [Alteromonadaceae]|uniref:CoA pyrophosphatase n=1 Tax=Alteromonadaceae TaxID=72275 RepID=UPI001C09EC9F|nr:MULTISPECIES: CoA pyrophosphatase [unclassified Aliiglaciecola]MBU2876114.1 CoA pyrophosphatase [Aliiglaciecola lipolytica]MDO6712185.1 CoA pyrophosphatase [Aliiglaciecola sp. 2_MG-2023]MDO6753577.1 CoA pyrophosphatase [Aliiglaciecola sp. 1_MG-2023]